MRSIVTLSLNPAIDSFATADAVRPLRKIRTVDEHHHAGGGGIIVARVMGELGRRARALYLAGGATGEMLEGMLAAAGINGRRIDIAGMTRIAHTVFERVSGMEYRFTPEGPAVSAGEFEACLDALAAMDFDVLVASGSLPRGLAPEAWHRVIDVAAGKAARVVLDTSGPGLRAALDRGVWLIKPSIGELETLVDRKLPDRRDQVEAARGLIAAGQCEIVAVSLGRGGALIVSDSEVHHRAAPVVTVHSALGAGDSFVAALTVALVEGWALDRALGYAVAAGAAAVMAPDMGGCRAADVERLFAALAGDAG
ncbi:1-phosphofructokinase family hexose kinase [Polymorphobacter sp.]|uniref:1-phosphofructokinase family hexose kinase n=1 Tax=Polymorphobacter sp. TaxID=1909290 RepID=UPI003F71139E